jgi:hypothetical protein
MKAQNGVSLSCSWAEHFSEGKVTPRTFLCFTKHHAKHKYRGVFLASEMDGGEWSGSSTGCFIPGKESMVPTGWAQEPVWTR